MAYQQFKVVAAIPEVVITLDMQQMDIRFQRLLGLRRPTMFPGVAIQYQLSSIVYRSMRTDFVTSIEFHVDIDEIS